MDIEDLRAELPTIPEMLSNLFQKTANEMAGPCPFCGGTDRLCVWPADDKYWCRRCQARGDRIDLHRYLNDHPIPLAAAAPVAPKSTKTPAAPKSKGRRGRILGTWNYTDADGQFLFQAVKVELIGGDKSKEFFQRRRGDNGGWVNNLKGVELVLYHLPDLAGALVVILCEGEKDADTVMKFGHKATTNPMGALNWRPEYSAALRGKHVIICPDNDEPGRLRVKKVGKALQGIAKSVKIIELPPGLPEGSDISDVISGYQSREEAAEVLNDLIDSAKPFEAEHAAHSLPGKSALSSAHIIDNEHLKCVDANSKPLHAAANRNNRNIDFEKGHRADSLFHIANCLHKGGMESNNILICLNFIASNCNPPFPENELKKKIESVLNRSDSRDKNLTAEVREWITATWGNITATEALQSITNATSADRKKIRVILGRLVSEGILERVPNRNGVYRKVDSQCEPIDFLNAETDTVDLWLPFGLDQMVEIMPGNIIVVAGEPDAGKTALLLNIIRQNMRKFEVHYFNSEMGSSELRKRLGKFDDIALSDWNFNSWERASDFGDVIRPGKGKVNIIDFLEVHDEFYKVGGMLAEIHKKLKGAIAIVALQKNKGTDTGLGGGRSLEKPRLYLAMSPGVLKIVKAKNWATSENPNGKQYDFKLVGGCKFVMSRDWCRV